MVITECADKEGNTTLRDIYYKCPMCGEKYDSYEEALTCLHNCVEYEYGLPKEYEFINEDEGEVCLN